MSDSEQLLFDMPQKPKKKRVMTEEQKDVLRERLKLAREKKRLNRESKSKPKSAPEPVNKDIQLLTPPMSSDDETNIDLSEPNLDIPDDNETDILKLQMDIEDLNMKLKKNKKQKTTARQIIYNRNRKMKQAQDIERLVDIKVNQKLGQKTTQQTVKPPTVKPPTVKPPTVKPPTVKPPTVKPPPRKPAPLGKRKPFW